MKAFLSYSNSDRELAGQIKQALEDYGLSVFLAHEDIKPMAEWVKTIRDELKECDIFIPILTESFNESDWTDQETGIAFILDKKIIPLKFTVDPHGFISRWQALKMRGDRMQNFVLRELAIGELANVIDSDPALADPFRDGLIRKFGNSMSFDDAGHNARLLSSLKAYTSRQLGDIIKYTNENDQIRKSRSAQRTLNGFFYKHKDTIDPKLLQELPLAIRPNLDS